MSATPRSARQLLIATLSAIAIAAVLLVCVVLPAEYGIDPLRTGELLGLGPLGEAKRVQAANARTEGNLMHAHPRKHRSVRIEINVKPREELEYKAKLAAGEPMLYSWNVQAEGTGAVYYEFHGEPTEGDWPKGYFRSYETVQSSQTANGSFVAPFTGMHGWYWRNLSDAPLTIVLEVSGYFTKLGRIEGPATPES
ncbi:hypothetical protein [Steroidobacter sp.]|uniref:hypothetical protein n=1 Tax=Steroidobacter sp. TaxID=1978227 RepID=UPI001A3F569F|nr:hypothetical protein [Steroidobacter sp.]MBL8271352.1 hypothetical protein [Steroidobacter sp.]